LDAFTGQEEVEQEREQKPAEAGDHGFVRVEGRAVAGEPGERGREGAEAGGERRRRKGRGGREGPRREEGEVDATLDVACGDESEDDGGEGRHEQEGAVRAEELFCFIVRGRGGEGG
jgi:hypothetical protein